MKKLIFTILTLLTLTFAIAQDGINYQGAATDVNGDELTNQNITIRASVLSASANGNLEWEETHSATTDQFGLFNVVIGQGTNTTNGAKASFDDMDWGSGNHFLKIEMDATGGTNYAMIGTTQMMSVPYALYAKSAGTSSVTTSVSTFGDTLFINGQSFIIPSISVQNFPSSLMGSVTDVDGNTYPTIILGNQEWMAANLNTTHFANGNNLNDNSGSNGPCSSQPGYKDNLNGNNFRYYNALAVHDSRNVCPSGWHVPSKAEFETLLGMFGYFSNNDWIGSAIALKSTEPFGWEYSVTSNASMLNFKPDGIIYCGSNNIAHTTESWTWTSTAHDPSNTNNISMNDNSGSNNNSNVSIPSHGNAYNLPIRCVKD